MTFQHLNIVMEIAVFLFAISIHESAHAWMANRCGDPTARMLGRITLNPLKHIDPVGTVLLPLLAAFTHLPMLGWAKPTPVDPRNFRNQVLDDILTSVVGPISNFLVAALAVLVMAAIAIASPLGKKIVHSLVDPSSMGLSPADTDSLLLPFTLLMYEFMVINVVLGVFNLIPVPPLDGSHVLRHFLPDSVRRVYDTIGIFGLLALVYFGPKFLGRLIRPVIDLFASVLLKT